MSENPAPGPDAPRKPLTVSVPQRPTTSHHGPVKPAAPGIGAPRILTARGASPPAPGSIVRNLLATRGWALVNAWAFFIFGLFTLFRAAGEWKKLGLRLKFGIFESGSAVALLLRLELIFSFALAAGCLYVAPRLFRYSGAIVRLRAASRMHELEKALRHQQAMWFVLGTLGAMWLLLFTFQLLNVVLHFSSPDAMEMESEGTE